MTRTFYILGIILMALIILNDIYASVIYLQIGNAFYQLPYIVEWHTIGYILEIPVFIVLFIYFRYKNYKHAFYALVALAIAALFLFITGFTWLQGRTWGIQDKVSFLIILSVLTIYGFVLIFSATSERTHLKWLGRFICVFTPIVATMYIIIITTNDPSLHETLNYAFQWAQIIGSVIPVLYIFNFLSELRGIPQKSKSVSLTTNP